MSLVLAGLLALSSAAAVPHASGARSAAEQAVAAAMDPATEPPPMAEEKADKAAYDAWVRSLVHTLGASADPRERALAAQFGFFAAITNGRLPTPAERAASGARLRAAAEAAPDDALIQSLWLQAEPDDSGCDARNPCPHRGEALVRVEPDNVVAWFAAVDAAWKRKDAAAIDSSLAQMAQARRYDDHMGEAQKAWMDIFARDPIPTPTADPDAAKYDPAAIAYTTAMSLAAATDIPAFRAVADSCHRDRNPDASPSRFRDCAQIGRIMLGHGDSLIGRMFGRALLRISGQATPSDIEMARTADWQQENWLQLAVGMQDPAKLNATAADSKRAGNEIELLQLEFKRAGIPLAPPIDWQPRDSKGEPVDPLGLKPAAAKAP